MTIQQSSESSKGEFLASVSSFQSLLCCSLSFSFESLPFTLSVLLSSRRYIPQRYLAKNKITGWISERDWARLQLFSPKHRAQLQQTDVVLMGCDTGLGKTAVFSLGALSALSDATNEMDFVGRGPDNPLYTLQAGYLAHRRGHNRQQRAAEHRQRQPPAAAAATGTWTDATIQRLNVETRSKQFYHEVLAQMRQRANKLAKDADLAQVVLFAGQPHRSQRGKRSTSAEPLFAFLSQFFLVVRLGEYNSSARNWKTGNKAKEGKTLRLKKDIDNSIYDRDDAAGESSFSSLALLLTQPSPRAICLRMVGEYEATWGMRPPGWFPPPDDQVDPAT